jgi:hypothetical protein
MKYLLNSLFLLILSGNFSLGQQYKKAVVTDVVFVRQTNVHVTNQSFPFYFHHKNFVADVLGDIEKFIKLKFLIDSVEFSVPDSITYYADFLPHSIKLKAQAKQLGGKDVLYVSVETILQEGASVNGLTSYRFVTNINIYTGKGRLYYRFKSIIPFENYDGEDIPGVVQMSDYDFYAFYFDGIQRAFEGTTKRESKRYVAKPLNDKYLTFSENAEKFYLNFAGHSYNYGSDFENLVEVLSLKNNNLVAGTGYFNFSLAFESNMVTEGIILNNKVHKKNYQVKLRTGENYIRKYVNPYEPIIIDYIGPTKDTSASFVSDRKLTFTGTFDSDYYKLVSNDYHNYFELYRNDSLIALINEMDDRKVILLDNFVTEIQLGDIINLMFAYDYSMAVEDKLYNL